nr:glycolate oxidase subunit GlcF [Herbaspirillum sp. ASV7]
MRVEFDQWMKASSAAPDAQRIIESCVHCGICTSVCPTYDLLDHELDSPRGRIYLIRDMLQGAPVSARTRDHLDRCLTCRACESACPSGVEYGRLIDIGREEVERRVPRSLVERIKRTLLRRALRSRRMLRVTLQVAWTLRGMMPAGLRRRIPAPPAALAVQPASQLARQHARRVLTLNGCVQGTVAPGYDQALARILDHFGVTLVTAKGTGCCGAISQHLGAADEAKQAMRRNIDAWWPLLEAGAEAIVLTSSGCGSMVEDYAHLLKDDPGYASKAKHISALLRDPVELVGSLWSVSNLPLAPLPSGQEQLVFHPPCSLQHGMRLKGRVELLLQRAGYQLAPVADGHLCCGSAGTYSLLQPVLAAQLGQRKLEKLMAGKPQQIASANVGCIMHLQKESPVPVRHWLEILAERLPAREQP